MVRTKKVIETVAGYVMSAAIFALLLATWIRVREALWPTASDEAMALSVVAISVIMTAIYIWRRLSFAAGRGKPRRDGSDKP